MNSFSYDKQYVEIIKKILDSPYSTENGKVRPKYKDGVSAHTKYLTFLSESFDISKNEFPIHSLRPTAWKSAIKEYFWIFQDQTANLKELNDRGVSYWNDWNIGDKTIGHRYGYTVNKYNLINNLIYNIKNDPYSRRHIIDLYQYQDFSETDGLYPCQYNHTFQIRGEYLDLITIIRSSDFLVANSINKIQAIALLMMISKATGYKSGYFHHIQNNVHIYNRHFEQAEELIDRYEKNKSNLSKPMFLLESNKKDFYEFTIDDFSLSNYFPIKPQLSFELGV